jgi:hypothetical protein
MSCWNIRVAVRNTGKTGRITELFGHERKWGAWKQCRNFRQYFLPVSHFITR